MSEQKKPAAKEAVKEGTNASEQVAREQISDDKDEGQDGAPGDTAQAPLPDETSQGQTAPEATAPKGKSATAAKPNPVEAKAKELFKNYPEANEFFFTADEMAFFKSDDATNHARTLKDKVVTSVKR